MFGFSDSEEEAQVAKEKLTKLAIAAEKEVATGVVSLQSGREVLAKAEAALLPMAAGVTSALEEAMAQAEKGQAEDEAEWDQSLQKLVDEVMVKVKATEAAAKTVEEAAAALAALCEEVKVNATSRTKAAQKVVKKLDAAMQTSLEDEVKAAAKSLVESDVLPFWAFGKAEATDSHRIVRAATTQVNVSELIATVRAKREKLQEAAAAAEKTAAGGPEAEGDQSQAGLLVLGVLVVAAAAYYVSSSGMGFSK